MYCQHQLACRCTCKHDCGGNCLLYNRNSAPYFERLATDFLVLTGGWRGHLWFWFGLGLVLFCVCVCFGLFWCLVWVSFFLLLFLSYFLCAFCNAAVSHWQPEASVRYFFFLLFKYSSCIWHLCCRDCPICEWALFHLNRRVGVETDKRSYGVVS